MKITNEKANSKTNNKMKDKVKRSNSSSGSNGSSDSSRYDEYKYFFYLMKDFQTLGIDTDSVIDEADFNRYEALVNGLYSSGSVIRELGLPKAMSKLN